MQLNNHFDEIPSLSNKEFANLADCTEFYYNEFGKLQQSGLDGGKLKKMKRILLKSMFADISKFATKDKVQSQLDKAIVAETKANIELKKKELYLDVKQQKLEQRKLSALINAPTKEYEIENLEYNNQAQLDMPESEIKEG